MKQRIKFLSVVLLSAALVAAGCKKNDDGGATSVTAVKMQKSADTVKVGETITLKYDLTPTEAVPDSVRWISSNADVARVDRNGVVTGVASGTATVSVTVNGKFSDNCKVTVRLATYPEAPELECITINGIVWAPVNCGYDAVNYPYGKLYQWGRKDGCGYKATDETSSYNDKGDLLQTTTSGPVSASDEDAGKFYKEDSYPFDWLTPQDSARWNSNLQWPGKETAPVKTQYDPCPTGWRVPTETELASLLGSHTSGELQDGTGVHSGMKGKWFDGSTASAPSSGLFLPAAGLRVYHGDANLRGSYGYYWSSSVNGGSVRYLYFYSGSANMLNSLRAYGFSVRCVQE